MKVIGITGNFNSDGPVKVELMADSSLLLSNKPFFLPDFAPRIVMHPAIALRVNRLGKSIASRFAHRYYDSLAACVVAEAQGEGLAQGDARYTAFDGAVMLGSCVPVAQLPSDIEVQVAIDGTAAGRASTGEMKIDCDHLIELLSRHFTLKMGDIIVSINDLQSRPLAIGENLTATIGGNDSLKIRIR